MTPGGRNEMNKQEKTKKQLRFVVFGVFVNFPCVAKLATQFLVIIPMPSEVKSISAAVDNVR
jgi:hypothetical protein